MTVILSLSHPISQLVGEAVSESSDEERPGSAHFPPYKPLQGPSSSTPPPFPIPPPPPAPANRGLLATNDKSFQLCTVVTFPLMDFRLP